MSETDTLDQTDNTVRARQERKISQTPLQGPGSIALMTFMAGPHISLFPVLTIFSRLSTPIAYRFLTILAAIGCPLLYAGMLLWKTKWYWASLITVTAHIGFAVSYYFLFRKLAARYPDEYAMELPPSAIQEKRYVLAGMAGGLGLIPLLGAPFVLLFLLASDKLLLTIMPLAFDDSTSLYLMIQAILSLLVTGFIAGGWAGRLALKSSALETIWNSLTLVWISLTWFFFLIVVITLPAFLTSQADSQTMGMSFLYFLVGNLFIGSWWSVYIQMYTLRPASFIRRGLRLLYAPIICLSSAFIFGIICGYPANWYHSAGKYFEKRGRVSPSLWCYEQGLGRNPTGPHASYLQYRIALGEHKLGNTEKAIKGFRKIVSMYNYNEELVSHANQFLDNLARNNHQGKRVVLPGVDNPTTYKGAYCVPNSLALVMNFWGADVDADDIGRQITSLAGGTMTVDQTWYAQQNGFNHEFIPMASTADIKETIDAGFPVMVYVPQHVFVIVGYDEQLETFVTYDVATGDVWVEYLQKDFIKSWKKENSTMIVAYPQEKADTLPIKLTRMIEEKSNSYFQYHLHKVQSFGQFNNLDHLEYAATSSSSYFFPIVTLFRNYPATRSRISSTFDIDGISTRIEAYYGRDFDEGMHLAGQYHDSSYADSDDDLKQSLDFLIGTNRLKEAKELIEAIEANGVISSDTSETLSIVNLALGDLERAIPQLEEQDDSQLHFYLAQSYLQQGKIRSALPGLVKTIDDCT
ncbi:C39 family peptidase [Desulfopila sp. IMCC35008]|uniref:C39 family peptidase n=1 Tax=Desulfopila sp. IMCC35008 TaxID=2653858 RepID=UPI0013D70D33|nr:C39 family peptidase [Desulfopila sp. IMCC35008]